jgi:hypothetical protein
MKKTLKKYLAMPAAVAGALALLSVPAAAYAQVGPPAAEQSHPPCVIRQYEPCADVSLLLAPEPAAVVPAAGGVSEAERRYHHEAMAHVHQDAIASSPAPMAGSPLGSLFRSLWNASAAMNRMLLDAAASAAHPQPGIALDYLKTTAGSMHSH